MTDFGSVHKSKQLTDFGSISKVTNALRILVKNSVKEGFYGKKIIIINILTIFFIFYKSNDKNFLKWMVNKLTWPILNFITLMWCLLNSKASLLLTKKKKHLLTVHGLGSVWIELIVAKTENTVAK